MPVIYSDYHKFHEIRTTPNGIFVNDRRLEGARSNSQHFDNFKDAIKYINRATNRRIV
jgi:hypothetical protein